jgi:menaquinone-dependent protoporphyrinogen oxidase
MSQILILFGTTEGQTGKIARFLADRLRTRGADVEILNALDSQTDLGLASFDAVVLAASIHTGRYQAAIEHFAQRHHERLNGMLSVFVSVSLAAAGDDDDDVQGLAHCVDDLRRATGWQPRHVHHVAGAFRYTQYDFFKRWALKYIAWRKGGPTDTSQDWELTDWHVLGAFADRLAVEAEQASAARP